MRASPTILLLLMVAGLVWWSFAGPGDAMAPASGRSDVAAAEVAAEGGSDVAGRAAIDAPRDEPQHAGVRQVAVARWTGRVMQAGAPLVGAELVCLPCHPAPFEVLARTRTASDGRFDLPAQRQECLFAVVHEAAPVGWRTPRMAPVPDFGVLDVPPPGVVVGRVRDADGIPVPNVEVVCALSSAAYAAAVGEQASLRAVTDREGAFRLVRIWPGVHQLRVDAAEFAFGQHRVEVIAGVEVTTELTLQRGVPLHGVVLDWRGKPLAGAVLTGSDARSSETDALGRFAFAHFRLGNHLDVKAPGHLPQSVQYVTKFDQVATVQLERAVTLRGVVHGADGKPGTLRIEPRESARRDASHTMPYLLVYQDLDVVRDDRFVVEGLSCAAFDLVVSVPGVGKVGPVRVEIEGDTDIELTLVPVQQVELVVRDEDGVSIEIAQLAVDPGAEKYPSLYPAGDGLAATILKNVSPVPIAAPGGRHTLAHPRGEALAFVLLAEGCLPAAQSFPAGEVPDRVELTMVRAGDLRGVVVGGDRAAYGAMFTFWPAGTELAPEDSDRLQGTYGAKQREWPRTAKVESDGTFAAVRLPAGEYRGVLARHNLRNAHEGSTGVPLVDGGADQRVEVAFTVVAGQTTTIEIADAPLGVLRGRVLVRGVPTAGVAVMASRSDVPSGSGLGRGPWDPNDWDNEINWQFAVGQVSDADGSFELRYRDAGPVQLRVRHPEGHATSSPLIVELPPPGADVVRDLHVPVGEIRGRFPIDAVPADARKDYRVTLFPIAKAGDDAFYSAGDYSIPIAWDCAHHEAAADGVFAFSYLPTGLWVVRVSTGVFGGGLLWQQVVEVQRGLVDLGEITPERPPVELAWQWKGVDGKEPDVFGLWLWRLVGEPPQRVWAGTVGGGAGSCDHLEPGRYEVQPFRRPESYAVYMIHGLSGPAIAAPVPITIGADGKVEPKVMTFVLLPPEHGK